MTADEYQRAAIRTQASQVKALGRLSVEYELDPHAATVPMQVNHSLLGLCGEAGEIAGLVQRWIWYGRYGDDLVPVNDDLRAQLKDEYGDALWYLCQGLTALGLSLADVMESNIAKLRVRFPEKYTDERAADENRDRAAEAAAVSGIEANLGRRAPAPHADTYSCPHCRRETVHTVYPDGRACVECGAVKVGAGDYGPPTRPVPGVAVTDDPEADLSPPQPRFCRYCAKPADCTVVWFRGAFGRPGPVRVAYCGQCSLGAALAKRGMTAPVVEGIDYRVERPVKIEQDGHGFGHADLGGEAGGA